MKKLTFILAAIVFMASCTSIEKLAEKGDYDGAILLAIKKIQGKKNKKTRHVQGLEEAFDKLTNRELSSAKRLIDQNRDSNWDNIYDIYTRIDERQNAVEPLLPLVSKDGYHAKFKFVNVSSLLNEAAENAAAYEYNVGLKLLDKGMAGNKEASRDAYTHFLSTKRYFNDYKDANNKANDALYYGKTRVLVDVKNKSNAFVPKEFEREVLNIHVRDLNTKWTEYYVKSVNNVPIDIHAILEIRTMEISPEREVVHHYDNEKRIKDGYRYIKDPSGNVMTDSLGNKMKKDKYRVVRAHITEIQRTKAALVRGNVFYYDKQTGEKFRTEAVKVEAIFEDFACQYTGDRRAIEDKYLTRLKSYPAPFPSDYAITMDAAVNLKEALKDNIHRTVF